MSKKKVHLPEDWKPFCQRCGTSLEHWGDFPEVKKAIEREPHKIWLTCDDCVTSKEYGEADWQ